MQRTKDHVDTLSMKTQNKKAGWLLGHRDQRNVRSLLWPVDCAGWFALVGVAEGRDNSPENCGPSWDHDFPTQSLIVSQTGPTACSGVCTNHKEKKKKRKKEGICKYILYLCIYPRRKSKMQPGVTGHAPMGIDNKMMPQHL